MKPTLSLLTFLTLIICFSSCKKNDASNPAPVTDPITKKKYISKITTINANGTYVTDYVYDSKKRLITLTDPYNNSITSFTYDDAGRVIKEEDNTNFQGVAITNVAAFVYQDAQSAKIVTNKQYDNGQLSSTTVSIYLLNGGSVKRINGGQLNLYLEAYDSKGVLIGNADVVYVYNGNLLKEEWGYDGIKQSYTYDLHGDLLTQENNSYTLTYTYTDKKDLALSPFSSSKSAYLIASINVKSAFTSVTTNSAYTFNAKGYVATRIDSNPNTANYIVKYEYDDDGYVVSITTSYADKPNNIEKTTYAYIE